MIKHRGRSGLRRRNRGVRHESRIALRERPAQPAPAVCLKEFEARGAYTWRAKQNDGSDDEGSNLSSPTGWRRSSLRMRAKGRTSSVEREAGRSAARAE